MRNFCYLSLLFLTLPFVAMGTEKPASTLMSEIEGVYKHRFINSSNHPEETWQAENIVEIVPVDQSHIYFRVSLEFAYGHKCAIWGIAEYENNAFVYHDTSKTVDTRPSCTLRISSTNKYLVLTDKIGTNEISSCSNYCGPRGNLTNYIISNSLKRRIHYLDKLKSSREYLESIDSLNKSKTSIEISNDAP